MKKSFTILLTSLLFIVVNAHAQQTWLVDGNAGIDTAKHFLGTTDNADLIFKRNNVRCGLIQLSNTSFGASSMQSIGIGTWNTAIGLAALEFSADGESNTAVGGGSLRNTTNGSFNTGIGAWALYYNNTGNYNTATGYYALQANQTGHHNSAHGYAALGNITTAQHNTASGSFTLWENFTGSNNTGVGYMALYKDKAGNNSAVGVQALYNNTTGHDNTAIGYKVLYANTTGDYNTAAGMNAFSTGNYTNSTAIGYNAGITASNQVRLGNTTVTSIGGYAGWSTISDARFKKDIKENIPGLAFIMKLRPVSYYLNMEQIARFTHVPDSLRLPDSEREKSAILQTGFLAQEVEKASLELGFDFSGIDKPKTNGDYYGLRYAEFVVPLVKAMQEQQMDLEKEKQKVKLLETLIGQLEIRLKAVEQQTGACPVL